LVGNGPRPTAKISDANSPLYPAKANQLFATGHKGGHLDGVLAVTKVGETIRKFLTE
jgi:hypothetical protein